MESRRFIWWPNRICRQESAWSLIQKFLLFNSFGQSELRELVVLDTNQKFPRQLNLTKPTPWAQALLDLIIAPEGGDTEDFKLLWPSEIKIFEHQDVVRALRYCLSCLSCGFHSSLFQLKSISKCPIHLESLREGCTGCGAPIGYHVCSGFNSTPFACACGFHLFQSNSPSVPDVANTKILESWIDWRSEVRNRCRHGLPLVPYQDPEMNRDAQQFLLREISSTIVAPPAVRYMLGAGSQFKSAAGRIRLRRESVTTIKLPEHHVEEALRRIVFSRWSAFHERLASTINTVHADCLHAKNESYGQSRPTYAPPWCSAIVGFDRWRDYWRFPSVVDRSYPRAVHDLVTDIVFRCSRLIEDSLQSDMEEVAVHLSDAAFFSTFNSAVCICRGEMALQVPSYTWPGLGDEDLPGWSFLETGISTELLIWHPNGIKEIEQEVLQPTEDHFRESAARALSLSRIDFEEHPVTQLLRRTDRPPHIEW